MTKKTRYEVSALAILLVVLAFFVYIEHSPNDAFEGVNTDDGKFQPLNFPDPALRVDLLARIQNEHYNGQHRNIFSEEPLPPPPEVVAQQKVLDAQRAATPPPPPASDDSGNVLRDRDRSCHRTEPRLLLEYR